MDFESDYAYLFYIWIRIAIFVTNHIYRIKKIIIYLMWYIYNIAVCFCVYWLSNLILWVPWSVSPILGQTLMLTVNPFIWGYASYKCIISYPKQNLFVGSVYNSLIFTLVAILSDLIFFGWIRNAMDNLMHRTTLYSWSFVFVLPYLVYLIAKKRNRRDDSVVLRDSLVPVSVGAVCLLCILYMIHNPLV